LERKYFVPADRIAQAAAMLSHSCRPDPQFPFGLVQSIYYDTSDLELFYQSIDGIRHRNKIRIRWYDKPDSRYATTYVEVKAKDGMAGRKARMQLQVEVSRLINPSIAGPIAYDQLCKVLLALGFLPARRIYPVIMIRYIRSRFVEIATGMRVSLDRQIESRLIAPRDAFVCNRVTLSGAVLELKGTGMELPPTLYWLLQMQANWTRYSKYAACLEAHMAEPGQVGNSMPSGRIDRG
jgi:hypothetical protein